MARATVKSGGPTRGRERKRKMGMGSGKAILKARTGGKTRVMPNPNAK